MLDLNLCAASLEDRHIREPYFCTVSLEDQRVLDLRFLTASFSTSMC